MFSPITLIFPLQCNNIFKTQSIDIFSILKSLDDKTIFFWKLASFPRDLFFRDSGVDGGGLHVQDSKAASHANIFRSRSSESVLSLNLSK